MSFRIGLVLAGMLAFPCMAEQPDRLQGHILGRQCADEGRIGECYLRWADEMVFRSATGEVLRIDLAAGGIRQERFDEAYGLEVELYGKVRRDHEGARLAVSQLNIVKPPGSREFFKG